MASIKKWFMLQMWRVQQIAAVMTLVLLAINLSLQVYEYMSWRSGLFASPYSGAMVILLILGAIIWGLSIVWDMRLRMWREQMTVLAERNPYAKEKMYAKEVVMFDRFWLPVMAKLGKDDPEVQRDVQSIRAWVDKLMKEDPALASEVREVESYLDRHPGGK